MRPRTHGICFNSARGSDDRASKLRRRWAVLTIVGLAVAAGLLAAGLWGGVSDTAEAHGTATSVDIDVITTGNTATSLGATDTCRRVETGNSFEIDVVIKDVSVAGGGLKGFAFTLLYDESVVNVTNVDARLFLAALNIEPNSEVTVSSDPLPDSNGIFDVSAVDVTGLPARDESGSGVLARVSLQAVGGGLSNLTVGIPDISPALTGSDNDSLEPSDPIYATWEGTINDAEIRVGFDCGGAIPNAPVADDLPLVTDQNTAAPVVLTGSDVDGCGGGQTFSFNIVSQPPNGGVVPASGSAACSGSGDLTANVTYTPDGGFSGSDSFTYEFSDGTLDSNTATVSVTVNPVTTVLVGDADCDTDVDAVDALFVLQNVAGLRGSSSECPPPSGFIFTTGSDSDCDLDVDAVDALFVLQHVAGLRPVLCP